MVFHSLLKKCMMIFGVTENMQILLVNSMKERETELTLGGQKLGTVKIRKVLDT